MNNKNISTDKANCLANEDKSNNNIENEVDNIFKEAPSEVRKTAMALMMRTSSGAFHHPIFDKFTPEHIDKFLDLNEQNNKREYHFACSNRWFNLGYALLIILFLIFLIIYLIPNNKDLLVDIVKIIIAFAGGFGVGYGWKAKK